MAKLTLGAFRKFGGNHEGDSLADDQLHMDDRGVQQSEDGVDFAPVHRTMVPLKVLLPLLAWFGLISLIAVVENGSGLLSANYWLSSKGLNFLTQAALPLVAVIVLHFVVDQLRSLREQADEFRAELRFGNNDLGSAGNVVSIRHAVHRELQALDEHLERSFNRTAEMEETIRREVASIEGTFADNERRMLALVQELARQRETVVTATEQVRDVVRTNREVLNDELANLAAQVLESGNYARGVVEEVNVELRDELGRQGSDFASSLKAMIADQIQPINEMLGHQVQAMETLLSDGNSGVVGAFETHGEALLSQLDGTWGRISAELDDRSKLAEEMSARLNGAISQSLESSINRLENRIKATSLQLLSVLDGAAENASTKIAEVGTASASAFDARVGSLSEQIDRQAGRFDQLVENAAHRFIPALERHNTTLSKVIELEGAFTQSTDRLDEMLTVKASEFVETLSDNLKDFQLQLGGQSEAISANLVGKLDRAVDALEDGSRRFSTTLLGVQDTVSVATDKLTIVAAEYNAQFAQRVGQFEALVSDGAERIDEQLGRGVSEIGAMLDGGAHSVGKVLGDWTDRIDVVLADGISRSETAVDTRIAGLQNLQDGHREKLQLVFEAAAQAMESLIVAGSGVLSGASEDAQERMAEITKSFDTELQALWTKFSGDLAAFSGTAKGALIEASAQSMAQLDGQMAEVTGTLQERLGSIYTGLEARTRELEANVTEVGSSINAHTTRLHRVLGQQAEAIEQNLEQGVDRLDQSLRTHLQQAQTVVARFAHDETAAFDDQMVRLNLALNGQSEALASRIEAARTVLETRHTEFESGIAQFATAIESQTSRLRDIVEQKSSGLDTQVGSSVSRIEDMLATQMQQARAMVESFVADEAAAFDRQMDVLSRTLESRSEILDSIMRTRGEDFTDKLYGAARQLEEELAKTSRALETTVSSGQGQLETRLREQANALQEAFRAALSEAQQATEARVKAIDLELGSRSAELKATLEAQSARLVDALGTQTGALQDVLQGGTSRIGKLLSAESAHLADKLEESAALLDRQSKVLGTQFEQRSTALANVVERSGEQVADSVQQAASEIERTVQKGTQHLRGTVDKSMETATQLLGSSVEATQQQVIASVETLLAKLAAHEKQAAGRMESAAASVGDTTRKAAEMTAERLVTLNGALVQVLNSLGTTRPSAVAKPKVEVLKNAAE